MLFMTTGMRKGIRKKLPPRFESLFAFPLLRFRQMGQAMVFQKL